MATKKKAKKAAVDITLWDVILSYPDLHDPKPYKGKIYYRTDLLLENDHPQLEDLRNAIHEVRESQWGDDKTEWPEGSSKPFLKNGNKREDQAETYKDRFFITASTQNPVPVVDPKGKPFNSQMVKGGMFANVAINISAWEYDGDEGMSVYLQGVQIDTSKPKLAGFGGGKSVDEMFGKKGGKKAAPDVDDDGGEEDDEDDKPRGKKKPGKKLSSKNFDDEDDNTPSKSKKGKKARDEEE